MPANKPEVGNKAPDFQATAIGGEYKGQEISLTDFKGKILILYFYPKDNTPGCTKQACALRDNWEQIRDKAIIFGVSIDSIESHKKFIDKFTLPFPLLSDPEKKIVEAYGVWIEKNMYGKKYMGTERSTFIIDEESKIKAIFSKVKPDEHINKILKVLPQSPCKGRADQ